MRARKHAPHEEEHENHERWLLTYADLITLLLALFMMLYAMSQLDIAKYQKFQEAFTKGMGGHPVEEAKEIAPDAADSAAAAAAAAPAASRTLDLEELKKLKAKLDKQLKEAGLQDQVQLNLQPRGLVMNIVSGVLFDSGSASLTKGGDALLHSLGVVFTTMDNKLVVEGHTDPRPISSAQFPSNWELSTSRATSVLRFLLDDRHLTAARMSAAGYADTRPRAANTTEASMARNRRVDIVVLAVPKAVPATPVQPATADKSGESTGADKAKEASGSSGH